MVETSKLLFWQAIHVWIFSGIAGTALRRQGRSVVRAAGPRHRRPRLRHRIHRRGAASAASRPPQARAPTVVVVRLSAPPPADRSVQRLRPRRCGTRSNGRGALPHLIAPRRAHTASTSAAALCPCRGCLPPRSPLSGATRIADRSWRSATVPLLPLVLCELSSLLASIWNVMPPGFCVKA